ncbi:hypothetical protein HDV00_000481 [Rhizophlyctis rosea]|nr:hypothetical protein HDV00_000481 [Rhizophlyctis rosea]
MITHTTLGISLPLSILSILLYRWRNDYHKLNQFQKYTIVVLFSVLLYPVSGAYKNWLDAWCLDETSLTTDECVDRYEWAVWIGHRVSYVAGYGFLHLSGALYLLTVLQRLQIFSPVLSIPRLLLPTLRWTTIILALAGWVTSVVPAFTRGKPETYLAYAVEGIFWLLFMASDITILTVMLKAYIRVQNLSNLSIHLHDVSQHTPYRPDNVPWRNELYQTSSTIPTDNVMSLSSICKSWTDKHNRREGRDLPSGQDEAVKVAKDVRREKRRKRMGLQIVWGVLILVDVAVLICMGVAFRTVPSDWGQQVFDLWVSLHYVIAIIFLIQLRDASASDNENRIADSNAGR